MSKIQIKAINDTIYLNRASTGNEQGHTWIISIEEARSLLEGDALRTAIAQATIAGKESRRAEIERLQARVKELQDLDKPLPDPNAPTIRKVKTMYSTTENQ